MICNSLIIGVQKAGTTSVHDWLSQHPSIYAPLALKDFHFFNDPYYLKRGIDFFESFFNKNELKKVNLAGAVNYIYFTEIAPDIKVYNPEMKLILCLRHPVDRAYSAFKFNKVKGIEDLNFQDALNAEQQRTRTLPNGPSDFSYFSHGCYANQIEKYMSVFPTAQIKIILFEDIKNNPENVCKQLFNFLEVDPSFQPEFRVLNESGLPKSKMLNTLLFKKNPIKIMLKKVGILDKIIPLDKRIVLRQKLRFLNTNTKKQVKTESISNEIFSSLQVRYKEEINKLEKLLEIDLENWKTKY